MGSQALGEGAMIELNDVCRHYGVRPVLRGVNLRIERGELVIVPG